MDDGKIGSALSQFAPAFSKKADAVPEKLYENGPHAE